MLLAPALALGAAAERGGVAGRSSTDLVLTSLLVAVPYATVVATRLSRRAPAGVRPADPWLSAVHGLVVLALAASALPALVLHGSARVSAPAADEGWPVLVGWAAVLGLAVLAGEGARRASLRWLAGPARRASKSRRD